MNSIINAVLEVPLVSKAALALLIFMSLASWAFMFGKWFTLRAALKPCKTALAGIDDADVGIAMYLTGPIFGLFGAASAGWFATRFNRKREALQSMALAALAVAGMLLPANNQSGAVIIYGIIFFLHGSYGFGCTVLYTLIMDKCEPASAGRGFFPADVADRRGGQSASRQAGKR